MRRERESVRRERERFFFLSSLLSKIYENRTVSFRWSKKVKSVHASRATHGYQNLSVSSNSER